MADMPMVLLGTGSFVCTLETARVREPSRVSEIRTQRCHSHSTELEIKVQKVRIQRMRRTSGCSAVGTRTKAEDAGVGLGWEHQAPWRT